MKRTRVCRVIVGLSFALTAQTCLASMVVAPPDLSAIATRQTAVEWPESTTVQELLRLDTEAALRLASLQRGASRPSVFGTVLHAKGASLAAAVQHDRLQVKAIYGVGTQLAADVEINGTLHHYRNERGVLADIASNSRYLLVSIDGHCIRMKKAGKMRRVCLPARLGGVLS
jgi:hypothetical protein